MKFSDCGIIINISNYGENSAIAKIFTQKHGIYRGFIKSIKSNKTKSIFQIGNLVSFEYVARLEENLGQFLSVDLDKSYCTKIIFDRQKLNCLNALFSIIDGAFLEKQEFEELFFRLENFLQQIIQEEDKQQILAKYVVLELDILRVLGYEIDLSTCVATNSAENLVFVSPKSAKAVCLEAGKAYEKKLLKLPQFLLDSTITPDNENLQDALKLTGYFLQKFLFENNSEKLLARKLL